MTLNCDDVKESGQRSPRRRRAPRRRTKRTEKVFIRLTPETLDRFMDFADEHELPLGDAIDKLLNEQTVSA